MGGARAVRDSKGRRIVEVLANGTQMSAAVEDRVLLSDFLRQNLRLTGTHVGCEHGVCGACTVLLDDEPVRSCLMFAVQADGRSVRTVEGLTGPDDPLSPVQQAFRETHALQCGFCTPGILMSVTRMLERTAEPTEADLDEALDGHICRCTGYVPIRRAIARAVEIRKEEPTDEQGSDE